MEQIRQLLGKMEKWDTKGKCGEEGHTLGKFRKQWNIWSILYASW
jgi:hypothetical protein